VVILTSSEHIFVSISIAWSANCQGKTVFLPGGLENIFSIEDSDFMKF